MSNQTRGVIRERIRQWVHLCEQANALGEATEIMAEAAEEILELEVLCYSYSDHNEALCEAAKAVLDVELSIATREDREVLDRLKKALNFYE